MLLILSFSGFRANQAWNVRGPAVAGLTTTSVPAAVRAARLSLKGFRKFFTTFLSSSALPAPCALAAATPITAVASRRSAGLIFRPATKAA